MTPGPETPADYASAMDQLRRNIERRMKADEIAPARTAGRPTFDYRGLSKLVRARIDERGLGFRGAAAEIGVTASDLSRIGGAQGITFEKVVAICDWLGLDPRSLYEAPALPRAAAPACGRAAPAGRATTPDGLAACSPTSTKSDCCSADHVKQGGVKQDATAARPVSAAPSGAEPAQAGERARTRR